MCTFRIGFRYAPGLSLRTVMREGAPWFVAKDVCDALGLDVSDTRRTLDEADREVLLAGQHPGLPNRGATAINESGLYSLILKSRKPEAKAFQKWVTSVVLPAIHKDGAYVVGIGSHTRRPPGDGDGSTAAPLS